MDTEPTGLGVVLGLDPLRDESARAVRRDRARGGRGPTRSEVPAACSPARVRSTRRRVLGRGVWELLRDARERGVSRRRGIHGLRRAVRRDLGVSVPRAAARGPRVRLTSRPPAAHALPRRRRRRRLRHRARAIDAPGRRDRDAERALAAAGERVRGEAADPDHGAQLVVAGGSSGRPAAAIVGAIRAVATIAGRTGSPSGALGHVDRDLGRHEPVGLLARALEQQLHAAAGDRLGDVELPSSKTARTGAGEMQQDAAVAADHGERLVVLVTQPALELERHPRPVAADTAHPRARLDVALDSARATRPS